MIQLAKRNGKIYMRAGNLTIHHTAHYQTRIGSLSESYFLIFLALSSLETIPSHPDSYDLPYEKLYFAVLAILNSKLS
jgi:hypothetical protein